MSNDMNHKQLAIQCFNQTWDYLDKKTRTLEEDEQMIHLAHVSFWHWTQVDTHTPVNLSIGYWQLSRVYAVAGISGRSLYFADKCLNISQSNELEPFYIAYAYEAAARALLLEDNFKQAIFAIECAKSLSSEIESEESKAMLLKDLLTLENLL